MTLDFTNANSDLQQQHSTQMTAAVMAERELAAANLSAAQMRPAAVMTTTDMSTMFSVAARHKVTVEQIKLWNPTVDPNAMSLGTELWLIDPATVPDVGQEPAPPPDPEPPPEPLPTGPRFPGDPGVGKVLTGGTVYSGTAGVPDGRAWLDTATGKKHLLVRRYYTNAFWTRTNIAADGAAGLIPFPSEKTTSTPAQIKAGAIDAAIRAEAQWAASQPFPIFTNYYHEPEDNFPSDAAAADYRAASRRIAQIFRSEGADNVCWVNAIYMAPWTFETASGRSWWKWHIDWRGTLSGGTRPTAADFYTGAERLADVEGFDQYSPHAGGGTTYREFADDMDKTLGVMRAGGWQPIPWVIAEFGTEQTEPAPFPPDGWTGYYQRAFRYMRDHDGIGFVTYNVNANNLVNAPGATQRLAGYKAALSSEAAYLVTTRP